MAIIKTNFEFIAATEAEVEDYYGTATRKINLLLEKYDVRNAGGEIEKLSTDALRNLLSPAGFFQATSIKSIFFDQKQQYIPLEIIHAFRSIISDPPENIKVLFLNTFITLLIEKGWNASLSDYFEKQYNVLSDDVILLKDLKDFSLGFGVYRATFQFRTAQREKITVFLKRSFGTDAYNELLYFYLQKEFLSSAKHANIPFILTNKENNETLLLSPIVSGVASDTVLSILTVAHHNNKNPQHGLKLIKTLEILLETFFSHAVLGDLLGRNDRHLLNSLFDFVVDGVPKNNTIEELIHPEKLLTYVDTILTHKTKAISLIDIDLKWLLGAKNTAWILADIDAGLSEINLLSLLPEFNDYNSITNPFFEKRKAYIKHYFSVYCRTQDAILKKKECIISAIKKIYPGTIAGRKLQLFMQRIHLVEKSKAPVVEIFKRYLLNFRMRLVYKETLIDLNRVAKKSNNKEFLHALNKTELLKYLIPDVDSYASSVLLQLQCFRGILSKNDMTILSETDRTPWETVATNISLIAEKFDPKLFKVLENNKHFITQDSSALLKFIFPDEMKISSDCISNRSALESFD